MWCKINLTVHVYSHIGNFILYTKSDISHIGNFILYTKSDIVYIVWSNTHKNDYKTQMFECFYKY